MRYEGTAAAGTLPNGPRFRSSPANGCSGFERDPGADDEAGPPIKAPLTLASLHA